MHHQKRKLQTARYLSASPVAAGNLRLLLKEKDKMIAITDGTNLCGLYIDDQFMAARSSSMWASLTTTVVGTGTMDRLLEW